ncbi:hypothetical protein A3A20_01340 [Candidatus Wolfebacteria bacterium RIFCSPLOWO2_01_FULL_45_19]|uniref:AAA+ ATPase domain-containing protein n=1 Tax=Candidatus Wolfebacteria bacterium RIFCSPLOWO2_01_FULL_45_19 TaxID=1802557 RepID=A0A1F8DSG9_9BACT|nr:MAG: Type II secretion system protein E [Parcubacteria group bacterium GW2011_GWB1_45_9]OGM91571.1 MAG: hypothetical protein A3A20_01340 [Candidatus Wolfebacteria bacterium RIFCSPLOWO2_01_FULL_45_19]
MLQIPSDKLKQILTDAGLITAEAFEQAREEAERLGTSTNDVLLSKNIITQTYLAEIVAEYLGVRKANFVEIQLDDNLVRMLPENVARQRRVVIFGRETDGTLDVAMEDPGNLETVELIERRFNAKVRPFLASDDDLNKAYAFYGKELSGDFQKIMEENVRQAFRSRAAGVEEAAKDVPIVALVDNILKYALSLRASDIHIEALEDIILIRYRVDGILHEILKLPKEISDAMAARIKLVSGLKLDEHSRPQDGRFRYKIEKEIVDVRVAIMPVFYGEKIEMRLLTAAQRPLSFEELGMEEDTVKTIKENTQKTYGIVLVTGPTGSGKTTTLYSILNILNRPEVNIVTIEDPIEYDIQYVNQTQINPQAGITFANGLRAILRQDPNVIMVGEIRDEETAEISVHSALTGHLVLSSLHTNDASTAVPRLTDMKIPAFLVAAVINAVLAQRLLRRVCTYCIQSQKPSSDVVEAVKKQWEELGISREFKPPKLVFKAKGCRSCNNTGYRGRMGIFEVLNVTENVRKLIVSSDFSLGALKNLARKEGMISMFEDGLRKAEKGMTTLEEVLRVIRE